jgi:hypothetical protein
MFDPLSCVHTIELLLTTSRSKAEDYGLVMPNPISETNQVVHLVRDSLQPMLSESENKSLLDAYIDNKNEELDEAANPTSERNHVV